MTHHPYTESCTCEECTVERNVMAIKPLYEERDRLTAHVALLREALGALLAAGYLLPSGEPQRLAIMDAEAKARVALDKTA